MTEKAATLPVPVPSATVLLLRDRQDALEVFMVVRHHEIDFASGALVFPGGKVDAADHDPQFADFMAPTWHDDADRALQVAACREVFEECGVILARSQSSEQLLGKDAAQALDPCRDLIHSGQLLFVDFLRQQQLILATDQLQKFAHWITPTMMPKRFDTHFYLARTPADQLAMHDQHESVNSTWIRPKQAIADAKSKKYNIIFPTLNNIIKLTRYLGVDAALSETAKLPIVLVLPWTEKREDGLYLMIDPAAGYQISEIKLPASRRPDLP